MPGIAETTETKNILIVEDNPVHRLLVERQLHGSYQLAPAVDSETALALLPPGQPPHFDLVIQDLRLPERSGGIPTFEEGFRILVVLDEVRRKFGAPLVIVMVSGDLDGELKKRLEKFAIVRVFEKPFSLVELRDLVDHLLASDGS